MAAEPAATSLPAAPQQTITATTPLPANFPSAPSFDVLDLLPAAAADRLRALRQRAADAHAVVPPFEDIREASMARIEAENALRRLTSHQQDGGFNLKPDDRRVIEATKTLNKATADLKRLQELQEVRTQAWRTASGALASVETWLREGRPHGTTLEVLEVEPPKLAKGENSLLDAIERLRRRGRELKATIHTIQSAPFPSSHAKQRMRAQIEALATQGAPSVSSLAEHDGKIEFQTQRLTSEVHGERRSLAFTEAVDAVALVAWLHRDALIAALDREITAESDDAAALTHEARQQREAEVMGDLLAVERDEAALVWRGQSEGLPVEHRADCDPFAILQLRLVTAPRAGNGHDGSLSAWGYDLIHGRR